MFDENKKNIYKHMFQKLQKNFREDVYAIGVQFP